MEANKMTIPMEVPGGFLKYNGARWVIDDMPCSEISILSILKIEDPSMQDAIVNILTYLYEPRAILHWIMSCSPTEEIRKTRYSIWQLIK